MSQDIFVVALDNFEHMIAFEDSTEAEEYFEIQENANRQPIFTKVDLLDSNEGAELLVGAQ